MVVAPGGEGELRHSAASRAALDYAKEGALRVKQGGGEEYFSIAGFMEVQPDHVIVLPTSPTESPTTSTSARAEEAKRRAEQMLKDRPAGVDIDAALASLLRRAQIRLAVAQKRGRHAALPEMRREQ